ncbi:MAG: penicillin acylase family protein, partial [Acetobacteraceae bacterium]|nr:penicillin acylase family protein [Acetobacteraceae bacterium]
GGQVVCGGECGKLLRSTLDDTAAALPDWQHTPWGSVHQATFAHPLIARLPLLGRLATWQIGQPGDDSTLFRGSSRASGWTSVHGPSYRGVYDLAKLDDSLFSLAPGQSGNPLSPTATSLMRRWRDGVPVRLGPEPEHISDRIGLTP